jgi:hypothetical protein
LRDLGAQLAVAGQIALERDAAVAQLRERFEQIPVPFPLAEPRRTQKARRALRRLGRERRNLDAEMERDAARGTVGRQLVDELATVAFGDDAGEARIAHLCRQQVAGEDVVLMRRAAERNAGDAVYYPRDRCRRREPGGVHVIDSQASHLVGDGERFRKRQHVHDSRAQAARSERDLQRTRPARGRGVFTACRNANAATRRSNSGSASTSAPSSAIAEVRRRRARGDQHDLHLSRDRAHLGLEELLGRCAREQRGHVGELHAPRPRRSES